MSFYRENVIWESYDGSWSRGFFHCWQTGEDPEWDVEYDWDSFEWVATGFPDELSAKDSWTGANPGGYETYRYEEFLELCEKYDVMAKECFNGW